MISEVHDLCRFGARFGLLERDDEIEACLGLLKRRFREMPKCSNRDTCYSSSINSDGD